jgi:hypothetical protein
MGKKFSSGYQPSPKAKSEGKLKKNFEKKVKNFLVDEYVRRQFLNGNEEIIDGATKIMNEWDYIITKRDYRSRLDLEASRVKKEILVGFSEFFNNVNIGEVERRVLAEETGKQLLLPINVGFAGICERCSYPKPYPQQIEMKDFAFGGGVRLLLGARKYGKTDYVSIMGVVEKLIENPNLTFLILSKAQSKVQDIIGEISRCLKVNGVDLEIDSLEKLKIRGKLGKQPNVVGLSIRSTNIRGNHVDYILCDDIITPDDKSEKERERVKKVYEELQSLNEGKSPNITIIGQPVHSKDLYAILRSLEDVPKFEIAYGAIPELDIELDILRAAGVTEESIKANYFLEIDSQYEKIPFSKTEEVSEFLYPECVAFVDPSMKGNDYTAMVLGYINFGKFIATGFVWKKSWDTCISDMLEIAKKYNVSQIVFETNGLGDYPVRLLRNEGLNVHGWNTCTEKNARIMNAGVQAKNIQLAHSSIFKTENSDFIKQVKEFEFQGHDDGPDCLANLMIKLRLIDDVIKEKRR